MSTFILKKKLKTIQLSIKTRLGAKTLSNEAINPPTKMWLMINIHYFVLITITINRLSLL